MIIDTMYKSDKFCPTCGDVEPDRYIKSHRCATCAKRAAEMYHAHIRHDFRLTDWRPGEMQSDMEMIEKHEIPNGRVSPKPCSQYGHIGVKTASGRCALCLAEPRTNRQIAKANGEKWYTPETPCKGCDTTAPRRVTDGRCSKCRPVKRRGPPRRAVRATLPPHLLGWLDEQPEPASELIENALTWFYGIEPPTGG